MINPKENAVDLVDKMYYNVRYDNNENYIPAKAWERAKQCALIACDEIIEVLHIADTGYNMVEFIEYWQQVRKEITKL
jgi:hypothetical protein